MNFFDDDFGLASPKKIPAPSVPKSSIAFDQMSRRSGKSVKKDEFDDLLDDLLSKEEKKATKKKEREAVQPFSSTQLDFQNSIPDFKRTEKWSTPNIDFINQNESPRFPKSRMNSLEDKGSEDGRSYKSGFTGQRNVELDNLMTMKQPESKEQPFLGRSSRSMMRPPLAKNVNREQSIREAKQPSVLNDDISIKFSRGMPESATNLQQPARGRRGDAQSVTPQNKTASQLDSKNIGTAEVRERVIEREKVVTVREEAAELKKQFDTQLKEIKQSYERQLKTTRQKWQEEAEQHKRSKDKLVRQYETQLANERKKHEQLHQDNVLRLKELHTWELTRKSQAYQMEIEKYKSICKMEDQITRQKASQGANQQFVQIKTKERQLQTEHKKIEELKYQLDQRQKDLQYEENSFQSYRRREEERLQNERKSLIQKENDLKRLLLEQKRTIGTQKQKLASQLASSQLQLIKKKETLSLQKDEISLQRDLLERQKSQFEQFSRSIMHDYKTKIKELQGEKQRVNELQIELFKKIHVVDLTAAEKGASKAAQQKPMGRPSSSYQENQRGRANSAVAWLQQTKDRFKDIESMARKGAMEFRQQKERASAKVNVSGYIARMNRSISRH